MLKFLKNLLGFDKETMKEAGVQIEQAPYKVEPTVLIDKVAAVNSQPIEKSVQEAPAAKPAKVTGLQICLSRLKGRRALRCDNRQGYALPA
jgi:hypothetical protein